MHDFTLKQIKTLSYLSNCKTFHEAGAKLGVSGTALRNQITTLEKAVGRPCIRKSVKEIVLTEFAESLLARGQYLLSEFDQLNDWIKNDEYEAGNIQVLTHDPIIFSVSILPYLDEFTELYPNICVHLMRTPPIHELKPVTADIYWGVGNYFGHRRQSLVGRELVVCTYGMFATRHYVSRFGSPKSMNDLKNNHRLLTSDATTPTGAIFSRSSHKDRSADYTIGKNYTIVAGSVLDIESEHCLGVFNAPFGYSKTQEKLQSGEFLPVLQSLWVNYMPLNIYYDTELRSNRLAQTFIQFFESKKDLWVPDWEKRAV